MPPTIDPDLLRRMNLWWRAANYLSVGQVYLLDNPLLREPLRIEHVKPRLLGHFGTVPGLNFIYVHLNRLIAQHDLDMMFVCGPGHGAPGVLANTWLEDTYSEVYPNVSQDADGLARFFRQFSFPGGIPSHCAPETPGSIREGGELGYALSHAYGAAFDNPDLIVACVIGDGEAETGPMATSWHSNKFLNPQTDGTVLPILYLNGYKIANPTVLARITHEELRKLLEGCGHTRHFVEGDDPATTHRQMAQALDEALEQIRAIRRSPGERPRWPMIVLRTPKGWTGSKEVDGKRVEGFWRASGAGGPHGETRPPPGARPMAAQLPAGGIVRRRGPSARRHHLAGAARPAAHERQSAHQRRRAPPRTQASGLPELRAAGRSPGSCGRRGDVRDGRVPARRDPAQRC